MNASHLSAVPEQSHYFATPELQQRLYLIEHLISHSEQLLFILAESGCGKTALRHQLQVRAAKHWWLYVLESSPALSPEAFAATLLQAFNVRQDGKNLSVLCETLRSHISATRYNAQLPVLLVDDAHKLPLATLRLIVELGMEEEAMTRMRVVLLCEPQINSILAAPEFAVLHNTLIHTLDIPPFSESQIRDYLSGYVQSTDYSHQHPFTQEQIKRIYQQSEGIPAQVILLAQQALAQFDATRQAAKPPELPEKKRLLWLTLLILLLAGTGYLIYRFDGHRDQPAPSSSETPAASISLPEPQSAQLSPESSSTTVEELTGPPEPPIIKTAPQRRQAETESTTVITETVEQPLVTKPEKADKIKQQGDNVSDAKAADILGRTQGRGEDWLRQQNPDAFTLQILGARDPLSLRKFMERYTLSGVAVYKTRYRDHDWYVLLYGLFDSRDEADQALKQLPETLRSRTQPWIRSLGDIQQRMNVSVE